MEKSRKIFTPISVFRILAACIIIVISSYSLGKGDTFSEVTKNWLHFITQLLFIFIFLSAGIEGVKDEDDKKRVLSYFYLSVAIILTIINTLTFFKIKL